MYHWKEIFPLQNKHMVKIIWKIFREILLVSLREW